MPGQVKVGVGLYILNNRNQLLLGLRRGAHGAGTWSLPEDISNSAKALNRLPFARLWKKPA